MEAVPMRAILVRVPETLAAEIERTAHANDRSINAEVRRLLRERFAPTAPVEAR